MLSVLFSTIMRFFFDTYHVFISFSIAVRAVTPVEVVQLTSADLDLLQSDATSTEYMNKLTKERSQARLPTLAPTLAVVQR